jgi:hypothetical protein
MRIAPPRFRFGRSPLAHVGSAVVAVPLDIALGARQAEHPPWPPLFKGGNEAVADDGDGTMAMGERLILRMPWVRLTGEARGETLIRRLRRHLPRWGDVNGRIRNGCREEYSNRCITTDSGSPLSPRERGWPRSGRVRGTSQAHRAMPFDHQRCRPRLPCGRYQRFAGPRNHAAACVGGGKQATSAWLIFRKPWDRHFGEARGETLIRRLRRHLPPRGEGNGCIGNGCREKCSNRCITTDSGIPLFPRGRGWPRSGRVRGTWQAPEAVTFAQNPSPPRSPMCRYECVAMRGNQAATHVGTGKQANGHTPPFRERGNQSPARISVRGDLFPPRLLVSGGAGTC